MAQRDYKGQ